VLAIPELAASIPCSPVIIDDLASLSDTDLQARALDAFQKLALWLLRDARAPRRLLDSFDTWIAAFAEAERAPTGIESIAALLAYLFHVIGPVHRGALRAKIRLLGPRAEEISMTIAEQLHEEGREEGREEGLEEGLVKGREEGRVVALRAVLASRFGSQALDAICEARLQVATAAVIDRYLQRVAVADSLVAVFAE
jgi:flagellar biosynthesis/type III secretory pathway protein FliH